MLAKVISKVTTFELIEFIEQKISNGSTCQLQHLQVAVYWNALIFFPFFFFLIVKIPN